jgi:Kef-type K+ transport system membrane component KefB
MGHLFRMMGQPPVVGEIVGGLLLGQTLLGDAGTDLLFPEELRPYLKALAALGLVLFMFIVGLELDLAVVRKKQRTAVTVSLASIALPFLLGSLLGLYLYSRHPPPEDERTRIAFVMFVGAAMSITAFPVLARILGDRGMLRTGLGGLAMASAAVDDIVAWSLLAVVIAAAGSAEDLARVWLAVPYIALMFLVVRPQLRRVTAWYHRAGRLTPDILAVLLVGLLLSAYATEWLRVHYVFGAFLFGAVIPREAAAQMFHEILERLEQVSVLLLLPVFFVVTGLGVDLSAVGRHGAVDLLLVMFVAVFGKFAGAYLGARSQGVHHNRAAALATLMNTRGLTELVILNVGREKGILDDQLFSIMVAMAVLTTVMTGPLLRLVYSDRRVARDIAEAEREALGVNAGYTVLAVVDDLEDGARVAGVAADLAASGPDPQVILLRAVTFASPALEVGSGLSAELAELATSAEALETLRQRVEARGLRCVVVTRFTDDVVREIVSASTTANADVVVLGAADDTYDHVVGAQASQVITVLGEPEMAGTVQLVPSSGADGDAALEAAVRTAIGRGGELTVRSDEGRASAKRAGGLVARIQKAGLRARLAEPNDPVAVTVAAPGAPVQLPAMVVRAQLDREPVDLAAILAESQHPVVRD